MLSCPSTGAVAAVEADVLLDTSTAPGSILLQLQARGPIGRYGFTLEAARVTGGQGLACSKGVQVLVLSI